MATVRPVDPSLLVIACCSRHVAGLDWAAERLQVPYGPISLVSQDFDFRHTSYYEKDMGPGLRKRFVAFERLVPSDCLADAKNDRPSLLFLLPKRWPL